MTWRAVICCPSPVSRSADPRRFIDERSGRERSGGDLGGPRAGAGPRTWTPARGSRSPPAMSSPRDTQVPNPKEHIMSGDTAITLVGNLTADPELRFTQSGVRVADFTVASTPRIFDRASGEWKDGDALFLRCTLWRQPAENVAETLTKGARVIVTGRLKQRSYETREGEKRTVVEVDVEEIGPSLRYATARVTRAGKTTTAAATRGPAPPPAGTTNPRSDPARARSGGGTGRGPGQK